MESMQLGNYQFYVAGSTCTNVLEGRHNDAMPKLYINTFIGICVKGETNTESLCWVSNHVRKLKSLPGAGQV